MTENSSPQPAHEPAPNDWRLPADLKAGHVTFRKGCHCSALVSRMEMLHREAFGVDNLTPEQKAENLAALQAGRSLPHDFTRQAVQAPEGGPDLRAAAQQAADALEKIARHFGVRRLGESTMADSTARSEAHAAIEALRAALAAQPQAAVATLPAQEAPAAVPMCSEQAVLHALTMARSETHQQGDAALWQAFGRAMWRQFNAMAAAAQAPAEGDEGELRAMLQKLGFGPQCAESIGITLLRWKDGYSAALESQAKPKVTLTDEQIDELWSQHGGGAFLTYVEHNRRRFAQIEDVKLRQLIRAVATAQAPAPAPQLPAGMALVPLGLIQRAQQAINWHLEPGSPEEHNATMLELSAIGWPGSVPRVQAPAVGAEEAATVAKEARSFLRETRKIIKANNALRTQANIRAWIERESALSARIDAVLSKPPVQGSES